MNKLVEPNKDWFAIVILVAILGYAIYTGDANMIDRIMTVAITILGVKTLSK